MRIASTQPPPPPKEITMAFPRDEGWAIRAALLEYADSHPHAADAKQWIEWARALDKELRP